MGRIAEMKESSGRYLDGLLENRVAWAWACFNGEKRVFMYRFRNEMAALLERKKENEDNLVISILYSSMVTGSNAYRIAWYDENIFLEENPACIFYSPEFLFRNLEEDVTDIKRYLHKNYIRLMNYEVEEIRRVYTGRLYREGKPFFAEMVKGMGNGSIKVWFGEHMKSLDFIGKV